MLTKQTTPETGSHASRPALALDNSTCGLIDGLWGVPIPSSYASSVKVIFRYLNQEKFECFQKKIYYSETKVKEYKDKDQDLSVSCPGSDPDRAEVLLSVAFTAKAAQARCAGFSRHMYPCLD